MARKVGKNEKTPLQNAAAVLLKKQGTIYEEWSQKIVSDNCLSLLQGNPEWRNKMLEGAAMDLIAASVVEEEKRTKHKVNRMHNRNLII